MIDAAQWTGLVRVIANSIHRRLPSHVDRDDLIGAGMLGLMDAVHKYHANKGTFKSYADIRIRGAIGDFLRENEDSLVGRGMRVRLRAIERMTIDLQQRMGHAVTAQEIADAMGVGLDWVRNAQALRFVPIGHKVVLPDGTEAEAHVLPDGTDMEDLQIRRESCEHLSKFVQLLSQREQLVLNLYYIEDLSLREIGELLNLGESRICQIHKTAIRRLRRMMWKERERWQ